MTPETHLTFEGVTQSIVDWALDYGLPPAVIIARLERGQSAQEAITTPMRTAPGQRLMGDHFPPIKRTPKPKAIPKPRPRKERGGMHGFNGERLTVRQWSARLNVSIDTLRARLRAGLAPENVFTSAKYGRTPTTPPTNEEETTMAIKVVLKDGTEIIEPNAVKAKKDGSGTYLYDAEGEQIAAFTDGLVSYTVTEAATIVQPFATNEPVPSAAE